MKYFSLIFFALFLNSCTKEDCREATIDLQACFDDNIEYTQSDQNYRDYIEHRTKWECLNIKNYEVTYESFIQVCYSGVLRLRVENGKVVEQKDLPSNNPSIHQATCIGKSIDDLFLNVKYAVDSLDIIGGYSEVRYVAHRSEITYNTTYYFPDTINVRISEWGLDDDYMYILTDFIEIE